jgi:SnoaL-like domain
MRYCRGLDRLDAELVASAFHADAVDHHSFATLRGAREIADALVDRQRRHHRTMHCVLNQMVEVEGEVARSEAYFHASLVTDRDGTEVLVEGAGRYVDRFERRAGEWRIATRVLVNEWSTWAPLRQPGQDAGTGAEPLRSWEDVSYRWDR